MSWPANDPGGNPPVIRWTRMGFGILRSVLTSPRRGAARAYTGSGLLLLPDEVGFALLDEGFDRLLMIFGVEGHHLVRERCVHDQIGLLLEPLVHRQFAPSNCPGRAVGEFLRELARLGHNLLWRNRIVHHPDAAGLGAADE